jgi:RNA polymerase sigma factor (sigma-70 family)
MTVENLLLLEESSLAVASLDETKDQDGEQPLMETIISPEDPLASSYRKIQANEVEAVLLTLPARERNVLRMHYGLLTKDGKGMTFQDIGATYGLSRERVRQIEVSAMQKLKEPYRAASIEDSIEDVT